jgi:hypothetical protein
MSLDDDYRAVVKRLRGWGFTITEYSGCYGRSNGTGWTHGRPVGHINHHYVCSMNPDQGYINSLVSSLANNETVQWFADVNGKAYLLGTGPMNHSGTGNSSVLNRTTKDQPNYGPASSAGDMSGNQTYAGTECQHPGDGTPWPETLLQIMFAINAAEFLQWGYTAERAINHSSWTNRKIDMSWMGGLNGQELVEQVQRYMSGGGDVPPPPIDEGDWFDMATKKDLEDAVRGQLNIYFASGEGNPTSGRIVQACNTSVKNSTGSLVDAVWNEVMPDNADGGNPEKNQPGRKARDTLSSLMTMVSRLYR